MTTSEIDMRHQVRALLAAAARRLLRARAAEAAAVTAIFAGLAAACLEAAWSIARVHLASAVALCLLPAGLAAVVCLCRPVRRAAALHGGQAHPALGVCAVASAAGVACLLTGAYAQSPKVLLPLVLLPGGALAGAAAVVLAGISPLEAAIYHDLHLGLKERLSTAAELAAADVPVPMARCIYAQALDAARRTRPERRPSWRRTRATPAALALAVALCIATALLPAWGVLDVERSFHRIADAAGQLTPAQRGDLIETLRRLEQQARDNPRLAEALRAAIQAAEKDVAEQLREELRRTEDALADADSAEAARIARALLAALGLPLEGSGGEGGKAAGRQGPTPPGPETAPPEPNAIAGQSAEPPLACRVLVYDRAYERPADGNHPPPSAGLPALPAGASPLVPLADAWTAAQDRAAANLAAGAIPPEYRQLIRRFYELK